MTVTETSKEAFKAIDEPTQAEMVMKALSQFGKDGATCEQVFDLMQDNVDYPKMFYGTVSARMTGLKDKNQIFPKKETRKTKSGNAADVFVHISHASDEEKIVEPQKPSAKAMLREIVEAELGFLKGISVSGVWDKGTKYRIEQMEKAMSILK